MNGASTALMIMGIAAVTMTAATVGFKAAAAPSADIAHDVDIVLQRRIDRAGASVAITADGAAVFRPDGDIIAAGTDDAIVFGCQCASERARAVATTADGNMLVIGVPDAREAVVMRRKKVGGAWFEHQVIRDTSPGFGHTLQLSPDGQRLFITSYESWGMYTFVGDLYSRSRTMPATVSAASRDVSWVVYASGGRIDIVHASSDGARWSIDKIDCERVMTVAVDDDGSSVFVAYTAADIVMFLQSGVSSRHVETIKNTIDGFGRAIGIASGLCFIGSPYEDRVYVYSLPSMKYVTTLTPDESGLGSEFGAQIAFGGDQDIAVLAPGYGERERGAVFIFRSSAASSAASI